MSYLAEAGGEYLHISSSYCWAQFSSPTSCISRIWDPEGKPENVNIANSSGQGLVWSRIYSKLGGFEEKIAPQQRTTSNNYQHSLPCKWRDWSFWFMRATTPISITQLSTWHAHINYNAPGTSELNARSTQVSELRWIYRNCAIQR